MNERVLIAGCGRIGTRLGTILAEDGATVWGLRRQPTGLPASLRPIPADLSQPETLRGKLPEGLDRVYYIVTPDSYDDAGYQRAFVTGLEHLLAALPRPASASLPRVVFVASTGVYAQNNGAWVDETSPTEPERFSGRRLLEAEETLARSDYPSVSLRFAGIYGRGRDRLITRVQEGAGCTGNPPRWTNRIHENDVVGVLKHVGALADPAPVYIGVDDEPATDCSVQDWLADRLGVTRPTRQTATGGSNKRCSNARLRASGYRFYAPTFRAGYAVMLSGVEYCSPQGQ